MTKNKKQTTLTANGKINKDPAPVAKEETKNMEIEEEEKAVPAPTTISKLSPDDFPPFDDFIDGLGSWRNALKNATSTKGFQNLYTFLKGEYKNKKVIMIIMKSKFSSITEYFESSLNDI